MKFPGSIVSEQPRVIVTNEFGELKKFMLSYIIEEENQTEKRERDKNMETCAQHSIKHCLDMIAPLGMPNGKQEDGWRQFYQFMVSLYRDMYKKPEEYMVFPKPYEEYTAKWKEQEAKKKKEKAHARSSRESTLRNTFQQAIQLRPVLL